MSLSSAVCSKVSEAHNHLRIGACMFRELTCFLSVLLCLDLQRAHTIHEADAQEDLSAVLAAMRLHSVASAHHLRLAAANEEKSANTKVLQDDSQNC